ncbi:hypothetical protein [Desulfovibrio sp. JC010]|uniref:hypothetical protein n=1 Tax=Desulfovibrio sp. JC010 TaxID=2593641 RepID=UPI0013CF850D|nr:hypothetical protein [Desulfovibrio sp. JC010]NDV27740.1 hypothetical protein [Desulfovibrio sp. JC010]
MNKETILTVVLQQNFRARDRDVEKIVDATLEAVGYEYENESYVRAGSDKEFRPIPAPQYKKDYASRFIRVNRESAYAHGRDRVKKGTVWFILRRLPAKEASTSVSLPGEPNDRWLHVQRLCKECGSILKEYVPESWIADGGIVFLEKVEK